MNTIVKQTPQNTLPAMTEGDLIMVLQSSLYPGAKIESIRMVIDYCRASGLDPMQKPVHIVPMWDSKISSMRDVVMPGVGLYRIQASRTGQFAGMSETEFGPMITEIIGGTETTFPEYARVTAKRVLSNGIIAEFTAIEYWTENYAVKGGTGKSIAPNTMWAKRPRGQIAKCAQAQALRLAFPELGAQPTADEMEGKQFNFEAEVTSYAELQQELIAAVNSTADAESLAKLWADRLPEIQKTKDMNLYNAFRAVVSTRGKEFTKADEDRTVESSPDSVDNNFPTLHPDSALDEDKNTEE